MPRQTSPSRRSRWIALIVGAVAACLFVLLLVAIPWGREVPLPIDLWWHDLMLSERNDVVLVIAWIPGWVGGTLGMIVIGFALVGGLFLFHRRWEALVVAVTMIVAIAIAAPLAAVMGRVRPDDSLAESVPTSFPSGHAALAAAVVVALALLFRRWWLWALAVVWIIFMAWSRTYLLAHWLTDVIAGALLGVAVALLVWSTMEAIRARRHARADAGEGRPAELDPR